jgi:hypothetical protein
LNDTIEIAFDYGYVNIQCVGFVDLLMTYAGVDC